MYPLTPHSMIKEKCVRERNFRTEFLEHFFGKSRYFFQHLSLSGGCGGSPRRDRNFVEKKSVHVIAKHRREKIVGVTILDEFSAFSMFSKCYGDVVF